MHAKLCLKQDGQIILTIENLRPLSGLCHFQLDTMIRPASLAEHASIKEKMRKHLRKSAFVSDELAETLRE
jgi:hypothetical protein